MTAPDVDRAVDPLPSILTELPNDSNRASPHTDLPVEKESQGTIVRAASDPRPSLPTAESTSAATNTGNFATTQVRRTAQDALDRIRLDGPAPTRHDDRGEDRDTRTEGDRSLLGQLRSYAGQRAPRLLELSDPRTLAALVRGGGVRQRRSALLRLVELATRDEGDAVRDEARSLLGTMIEEESAVLAYELAVASRVLGTRAVRHGDQRFASLVERLSQLISHFWEGDDGAEPVVLLSSHDRALLASRARDLPVDVIAHLGSIIEGTDGVSDATARKQIATSLRFAGDPRLVPALRIALHGNDASLRYHAAAALGSIDDARALEALRKAFDVEVNLRVRLAIGAALGELGDFRAASLARQVLTDPNSVERSEAATTLGIVGNAEDTEVLLVQLEASDVEAVLATVDALERVGSARAAEPLSSLLERTTVSAVRAHCEDALRAIRARVELRGETMPTKRDAQAAARARVAAKKGAESPLAATDDPHVEPLWVRVRAQLDLFVGVMARFVGAHATTVARFESAAARRPAWAEPLIRLALYFASRDDDARALGVFRRAFERDRAVVERTRAAVDGFASSLVRRGDALAREGKRDVARGLLEEASLLDLRLVRGTLRAELASRRETFRAS